MDMVIVVFFVEELAVILSACEGGETVWAPNLSGVDYIYSWTVLGCGTNDVVVIDLLHSIGTTRLSHPLSVYYPYWGCTSRKEPLLRQGQLQWRR